MAERINGFEPIVFEDTKIILLGTLPGSESLEKGYYYADNRNYLWHFFNQYAGTPLPVCKQDTLKILKKIKIGLWDIFESGIRVSKNELKSSKDDNIRDVVYNDIPQLLSDNPQIKKIGVLGRTAQKAFKEKYPNISFTPLTSTSGSNSARWGKKLCLDRARSGWQSMVSFIEQP